MICITLLWLWFASSGNPPEMWSRPHSSFAPLVASHFETSENVFFFLLCRFGPWASVKDPLEVKPKKLTLQKGMLVEFRKDSGRTLLGVTQNQEGKRNWCVLDQVITISTCKIVLIFGHAITIQHCINLFLFHNVGFVWKCFACIFRILWHRASKGVDWG